MRLPSITDQVVISGGQAVTKRQPHLPDGTGRRLVADASRRSVLWIPSAPITRSYSPAVPSPQLDRDRVVPLRPDRADADSHPDRHLPRPVEQHRMEVGALKR